MVCVMRLGEGYIVYVRIMSTYVNRPFWQEISAVTSVSVLLHCTSGHSDSDEGLASTLHSEHKSVATDYLETFQMHRFLEGSTVNKKGEGSNYDSGIVRSKRGARTITSYLTEVIVWGLETISADASVHNIKL